MNFIESLQEDRLVLISALRRNNAEDGFKNLLTELYPDNAHFIYELLQNAEDAQASKVTFTLEIEGLIFKHNGYKQFTKKDIDSITNFGNSTKKDDFNQIGKFGVGFKAVFSYTETPQIYSGDYAFEIYDLICLKTIPQILKNSDEFTLFRFPFNSSQKSKENAFTEIKSALLDLPDNTILFLKNIKEIQWEIIEDTKQTGFIRSSQLIENDYFEIEKKINKSQKTYWLRFIREIPKKKGLFVAIAFRLIKTKNDEIKIDSKVNKGNVSIFFSAEKENSGLKFFVHAPFAATVARDSIQNKPENEQLRDLLIDLLIESISKIKEQGLLDRNFLAILPNDEDELSEFYEPFRSAVTEAFQNQNYTPTSSGGFLPATKLLQSKSEIKKVINKETILPDLLEDKDVEWSISHSNNARVCDFLKSLEIEEWDWVDLIDKIDFILTEEERANEILAKMSDEWLQSFYILLGKAKEQYKESHYYSVPELSNAYIVRVQNGNHVCSNNVYFQTESVKKAKNLSLVKTEIYQSNQDTKQNEKAIKFLRELGVKEFEERDEIKLILEQYYKRYWFSDITKISEDQHIKHIKKFVKFWKRNSKEIFVFTEYSILRVEDEDNEYYCKPSDVFIDKPYENTKLSTIEPYLEEREIWQGYSTQIKNQEDFISFIKDLGVTSKLEIKKVAVWNNHYKNSLILDKSNGIRESAHCINNDYMITNLESLLKKNNRSISLMIWEIISNANEEIFEAKYRPNLNYDVRTAPSQIVYELKRHAWIPGKDGKFYKPQKISREILLDNFKIGKNNRWLSVIGFGEETEKQNAKKQEKNNFAKALGFDSIDEVSEALKLLEAKKEGRIKISEKLIENVRNNHSPTKTNSNSILEKKNEKNSNLPNTDKYVDDMQQERNKTIAEDDEERKIALKNISQIEKETLVKSRIGQGLFRTNLEKIENECRLTGVKRFLIASHIKAWKDSNDEEKLDGNNGLLLSPHVDKLFDKGWISFTDDGEILCKNDEIKEIMKLWGLDTNKKIGNFNDKQKEYLAYHRKIFDF